MTQLIATEKSQNFLTVLNMVEKAVVNASLLTIALVLLGFSLLIIAHLCRNPSSGEQFCFLEGSTKFSRIANGWFAPRLLATISKEMDRQVGKLERFSADEWSNEIVPQNVQLVFILSLFLCGLFSNPSRRCASKGMYNTRQKQKKTKRRNKSRKKRGRTSLRTIKRGKK